MRKAEEVLKATYEKMIAERPQENYMTWEEAQEDGQISYLVEFAKEYAKEAIDAQLAVAAKEVRACIYEGQASVYRGTIIDSTRIELK